MLASVRGLTAYLAFHRVRLTEFKPYVTRVTEALRREVEAGAEQAGVAIEYVHDASLSKEELAKLGQARDARRASAPS